MEIRNCPVGFEFEIVGKHAVLKKVDFIMMAGNVVIPSIYKGKPVTAISNGAFFGCTDLTSVVIPDSVTTIGDYAFNYCTSLTSVTFGENSQLTTIGEAAFYYCRNLTSIVIPDSVTTIGYGAFFDCTSLTSITLPFIGATKDGTKDTHFGYIFGAPSYGNNGMFVPTSLKIVNITGGTTIGEAAFYYCRNLTSIVIPDSVTSIGYETFYYCTSLTDVYYTGTLQQWYNIAIDRQNYALTSVTIHYNYVKKQ